MPDPHIPIPPTKVSCHVCRAEIPRSTARTAEGRDYTYYFCDANCYDKWRSGGPAQDKEHRPPR